MSFIGKLGGFAFKRTEKEKDKDAERECPTSSLLNFRPELDRGSHDWLSMQAPGRVTKAAMGRMDIRQRTVLLHQLSRRDPSHRHCQ